MAKSNYERLLEKQLRQDKEAQRKRQQEAKQAAIRERAASIVNGQPILGGMRIMDEAAEEILKVILVAYSGGKNRTASGDTDVFPSSYRFSLSDEFEKLRMYGMLSSYEIWISGQWEVALAPQAISYFEQKEQAIKRHEEEQKMQSIGGINNYGNLIFGNVTNSTLSVDNSVHEIERLIDKEGGEDKEELHELLEEIKELIENMQASRSVPKQKKLIQRISDHAAKHGWFYGAVVQLLGTATFAMLGAQ